MLDESTFKKIGRKGEGRDVFWSILFSHWVCLVYVASEVYSRIFCRTLWVVRDGFSLFFYSMGCYTLSSACMYVLPPDTPQEFSALIISPWLTCPGIKMGNARWMTQIIWRGVIFGWPSLAAPSIWKANKVLASKVAIPFLDHAWRIARPKTHFIVHQNEKYNNGWV